MASQRTVQMRMLKHDGLCYRHHPSELLYQSDKGQVLLTPAGGDVWFHKGSFVGENRLVHYHWPDRWYNVIEVFSPGGQLLELYAHIAKPATLDGTRFSYVDYELDVVLFAQPESRPQMLDEDEFAEAAQAFNYSDDLQARCRQAAAEAAELLPIWRVGLPPAEALSQSVPKHSTETTGATQ